MGRQTSRSVVRSFQSMEGLGTIDLLATGHLSRRRSRVDDVVGGVHRFLPAGGRDSILENDQQHLRCGDPGFSAVAGWNGHQVVRKEVQCIIEKMITANLFSLLTIYYLRCTVAINFR